MDQKQFKKSLNIFCNICEESILNGEKRHISRRVTVDNNRQWNTRFHTPVYLNFIKTLNVKRPTNLRSIYQDINDRDATFLQEPVLLTLHFKNAS